MEIHDITKSSHNLRHPVKQAKNAIVFHIKQVNDEDVKYYEFGINKVFEEKFSIRCKQCKCHIQLPNNGIEVEERRTGKSRTFAISSQASEEDLLEKNNYGEPFHEHNKKCQIKCTALHRRNCGMHKYQNVQRRFRTASVRNAIKV